MTQKKPTLKQVLELVTVKQVGKEGKWAICGIAGSVHGDICGHVYGNIFGAIYGDVCFEVRGDVKGSVWGDVGGDVQGNVGGDVRGRIKGRSFGGRSFGAYLSYLFCGENDET